MEAHQNNHAGPARHNHPHLGIIHQEFSNIGSHFTADTNIKRPSYFDDADLQLSDPTTTTGTDAAGPDIASDTPNKNNKSHTKREWMSIERPLKRFRLIAPVDEAPWHNLAAVEKPHKDHNPTTQNQNQDQDQADAQDRKTSTHSKNGSRRGAVAPKLV